MPSSGSTSAGHAAPDLAHLVGTLHPLPECNSDLHLLAIEAIRSRNARLLEVGGVGDHARVEIRHGQNSADGGVNRCTGVRSRESAARADGPFIVASRGNSGCRRPDVHRYRHSAISCQPRPIGTAPRTGCLSGKWRVEVHRCSFAADTASVRREFMQQVVAYAVSALAQPWSVRVHAPVGRACP